MWNNIIVSLKRLKNYYGTKKTFGDIWLKGIGIGFKSYEHLVSPVLFQWFRCCCCFQILYKYTSKIFKFKIDVIRVMLFISIVTVDTLLCPTICKSPYKIFILEQNSVYCL